MKNGLKRKQKTDYILLAMNELWSAGRPPPHPTHNWKIHRDLPPENMPQSEGIYPLLSPPSMMELKEQDNNL